MLLAIAGLLVCVFVVLVVGALLCFAVGVVACWWLPDVVRVYVCGVLLVDAVCDCLLLVAVVVCVVVQVWCWGCLILWLTAVVGD